MDHLADPSQKHRHSGREVHQSKGLGLIKNFIWMWISLIFIPYCLDCLFKLIRNIQFMSIKQQNYFIGSFSEPFKHSSKIVTPVDHLLLPWQDSRSIKKSHTLESLGVALRCFKSVEEGAAELLKMSKRFCWVNG